MSRALIWTYRNSGEIRWLLCRPPASFWPGARAAGDDETHRAPNPDLLHRLPVTPVDLAVLPDDLSRRLFEALRLEIHYDGVINEAVCRVTLTADTIEAVSRTAHQTVASPPRWDDAVSRKILDTKEKKMDGRNDHATISMVPPAGSAGHGNRKIPCSVRNS